MSTFKFGEIRVDVHRTGPDPLHPNSDFYAVRISQGDTFMESRREMPKANRTAGSDFEIAAEYLSSMYMIARNPEDWATEMQSMGEMSQEEIDAVTQVAGNLAPYLNDAMRSTKGRFELYSEHFEAGVGPYDPSIGIARRLELPEKIRTKEDIARFFAYLYLVDHTSFHPDERFGTYVKWGTHGELAYTKEEAKTRDRLMRESWAVAGANNLDIYDMSLWVGALTGANDDPENEASAPNWLKSISNQWV